MVLSTALHTQLPQIQVHMSTYDPSMGVHVYVQCVCIRCMGVHVCVHVGASMCVYMCVHVCMVYGCACIGM